MRQSDAQSLVGGEVGRCGGGYELLTANGRAAERIPDSALLATASLCTSQLPVYPPASATARLPPPSPPSLPSPGFFFLPPPPFPLPLLLLPCTLTTLEITAALLPGPGFELCTGSRAPSKCCVSFPPSVTIVVSPQSWCLAHSRASMALRAHAFLEADLCSQPLGGHSYLISAAAVFREG